MRVALYVFGHKQKDTGRLCLLTVLLKTYDPRVERRCVERHKNVFLVAFNSTTVTVVTVNKSRNDWNRWERRIDLMTVCVGFQFIYLCSIEWINREWQLVHSRTTYFWKQGETKLHDLALVTVTKAIVNRNWQIFIISSIFVSTLMFSNCSNDMWR